MKVFIDIRFIVRIRGIYSIVLMKFFFDRGFGIS